MPKFDLNLDRVFINITRVSRRMLCVMAYGRPLAGEDRRVGSARLRLGHECA